MDIVIIADFCGTFDRKYNNRFLYLAELLSKSNDVEVVTSDFNHDSKMYFNHTPTERSYKVTMLHEGAYKKNISVKRFISHYIWGRNIRKYLENRKQPDVIYCAVPTLTAAREAAVFCENNDIKFIIDIQDLWPEAFRMILNIPVISTIAFLPFKLAADAVYKRADDIVAVSDTYVERALSINGKCMNGHTVFLGTKLEEFDNNVTCKPFIEKYDGEIWIGYCGSLSASYDIPNLIHAVRKLQENNVQGIRLIIMGDGDYKHQFESLAIESCISSVFTGHLPYKQMCATLKQCDIVVNPIKHGSAASIINKHGDYASAGLPVVNSQENIEYRDLIDTYKMGLNCNNEDANDMALKIEKFILDEKLRIEMGKNARRCAEEKFDRKKSYVKILSIITNEEKE
ncbi:MAG: glycosyltransferase family 4 protein [Lachnospiraceae bacterium]|nr:glycosyltransferase family 4 protein [Lachnospiraceae bacterium]